MVSLKRLAVFFAMEEEAMPFIQSLSLAPDKDFGDSKLPFRYYRGRFKSSFDVLVAVNGKDPRYGVDNIGTEPATLNAYITLRQYMPDLCLSVGTAGGFQHKGASIGDVYLSTEAFRFHDRRIQIPGFSEYGVGHYPVFEIEGMAETLGLKKGVVSTANSLDYSEKDWEMMKKNNASVKEMEAAGIAWVAHLLHTPLLGLKAVTDFVDSPEKTEEQFFAHFALAIKKLHSNLHQVLDYLASIQ
jgi:nucleoside phosphorylase